MTTLTDADREALYPIVRKSVGAYAVVERVIARHVRAEFAFFGLCPECGGKAAGCAAARIACCPDCKHTAEQLQAAIT